MTSSSRPRSVSLSSASYFEALIDSVVVLPGEESDAWEGHRRYVCLALIATLSLESIKRVARADGSVTLCALCALAFALVLGQRPRAGTVLATACALWSIVSTAPLTPNHGYLQALALGICTWASFEPKLRSQSLLRWLIFVVLFWAGAQKLLHGSYWNGSFLAVKIASGEPRFQWLRLLLDTRDLNALSSATSYTEFVLHEPLPLAISRSIPVLELGLGASLMHPRLRRFAAVGAMLLVVLLQFAAGEMTFALSMLAALIACAKPDEARYLMHTVWISCLGLILLALLDPQSTLN